MIDWSRVAELRDEVGADDFGEVVDLFLDEVEEVLARLGGDRDATRFEDDFHFLKGSALSLGFRAFSNLCRDGERLTAEGRAQDVDVTEILAVYEASKAEFVAQLDLKLAS